MLLRGPGFSLCAEPLTVFQSHLYVHGCVPTENPTSPELRGRHPQEAHGQDVASVPGAADSVTIAFLVGVARFPLHRVWGDRCTWMCC
jgi:hypothetical protein